MRKTSSLRDVCLPGFSPMFNEVDCVVAVVNVLSLNDKLQAEMKTEFLGIDRITPYQFQSINPNLVKGG